MLRPSFMDNKNPLRSYFCLIYFLLAGLIFTLLLDANLPDYSGFCWAVKYLFSSVFVSIILVLLMANRWVAYTVTPLFFCFLACIAFAKWAYNYELNDNLVWGTLEVNTMGILRWMTWANVLGGILLLSVVELCVLFLRKQLLRFYGILNKWKVMSACLGALLCMMALVAGLNYLFPRVALTLAPNPVRYDILRRQINIDETKQTGIFKPFFWPASPVLLTARSVYVYYVQADLVDPASMPSELMHEEKPGDEMIIVFFIGESVRYDHMSLHGYPKKTTPELDAWSGIVSFSDFWSYATSTSACFMGIFTDATTQGKPAHYGAFFSVLRKHGFKVFMVTDGQADFFMHGKWTKIFGKYVDVEAKTDYDQRYEVDKLFAKVLEEPEREKRLICLHVGSCPVFGRRRTLHAWRPAFSDGTMAYPSHLLVFGFL